MKGMSIVTLQHVEQMIQVMGTEERLKVSQNMKNPGLRHMVNTV